MRFVHVGDCHLGGWRHPKLSELNFQSFQKVISKCIEIKSDFLLITGDLFDSAYPPIEILKETFSEFKKLKEEDIPVFLIAGSHDYSASGKTFLDVLEKAGFCKNVSQYEIKDEKIILHPTIFKGIALYGYPGKKSGLEVDDIARIKLQDSPGLFKILMLHTTIKGAIGNIPMKSVDETLLPKVDYLALSHLHINYRKDNLVYSGPTFPNNITELEDLKAGSYYIYDSGRLIRNEISIKQVVSVNLEIKDTINSTEKIISALKEKDLKDKIVILKLFGIVDQGKTADIDFSKVENFVHENQGFIFLKNTSKLFISNPDISFELTDTDNYEAQIISSFERDNNSRFNSLIHNLIKSLQLEKQEDEKLAVFEERIISECDKIIGK